MIYAIITWLLLGVSTAWIVYESVHAKQLSLINKGSRQHIAEVVIIRLHAKLLIMLIIVWWMVYLLTNIVHIHHAITSMNMTVTVVIMTVLTPILAFVINRIKCRKCQFNDTETVENYTKISWTLNILTAFIYASIINYGIQMLLMI